MGTGNANPLVILMPIRMPEVVTVTNQRIMSPLRREDPRDAVLIKSSLASEHKSLSDLPAGAIVGTSAVRRSAQIRQGIGIVSECQPLKRLRESVPCLI